MSGPAEHHPTAPPPGGGGTYAPGPGYQGQNYWTPHTPPPRPGNGVGRGVLVVVVAVVAFAALIFGVRLLKDPPPVPATPTPTPAVNTSAPPPSPTPPRPMPPAPPSTAPTTSPAPTPTTSPPPSPSPSAPPTGEVVTTLPSGSWLAVLASFSKTDRTVEQALARAQELSTDQHPVVVLDSDRIAGLNPGYWAVAVVGLSSREAARASCVDLGRELGSQCYPRQVG